MAEQYCSAGSGCIASCVTVTALAQYLCTASKQQLLPFYLISLSGHWVFSTVEISVNISVQPIPQYTTAILGYLLKIFSEYW